MTRLCSTARLCTAWQGMAERCKAWPGTARRAVMLDSAAQRARHAHAGRSRGGAQAARRRTQPSPMPLPCRPGTRSRTLPRRTFPHVRACHRCAACGSLHACLLVSRATGGAAQIRRPRSGVACAASAVRKLGWPCSPARVRASVGRRTLGLLTAGMGTREVQAMVSKLTLFSQSEGPQTCGTAARERGRLGWAVGCFRTDTLLGVLSSGRAVQPLGLIGRLHVRGGLARARRA